MNKIVFFIVFVASLVFILNEKYRYRDFNSDKGRQVHAAYNLLHNDGVSYRSIDLRNGEALTKPIIDWPPAYSYLVAGASYLTNGDLFAASVFTDMLFIVLMWVGLFWIMSLLRMDILQQMLVFVFLATSKTPLLFVIGSDLYGGVFFLFSAALAVWYVKYAKQDRRDNILFYLLQLISITAMVFLKYSLFPATFVFGASMIAYAMHHGRKKYYSKGAILIIFGFVAFAMLLMYNKSVSGLYSNMSTRHDESISGWYFENLLHVNPYAIQSFIYYVPISLRVPSIFNVISVLSAVILLVLFFILAKRILQGKGAFFDYLLLCTNLFMLAFLGYMSVKNPMDNPGPDYYWTYVMEFRYYFPSILLLVLMVFRNSRFVVKVKQVRVGIIPVLLVVYSIGLYMYYMAVHNDVGTFERHYRPVVDVADYVDSIANEHTVFMSYSELAPEDAKITSFVASRGVDVSMSYYKYFPDNTFNVPFTGKIKEGIKLVMFIGENEDVIKNLSPENDYTITDTKSGKFIVFK